MAHVKSRGLSRVVEIARSTVRRHTLRTATANEPSSVAVETEDEAKRSAAIVVNVHGRGSLTSTRR